MVSAFVYLRHLFDTMAQMFLFIYYFYLASPMGRVTLTPASPGGRGVDYILETPHCDVSTELLWESTYILIPLPLGEVR